MPQSYLTSSVPDWLQQAATLNCLIGMADLPVLSEAQIKLDTKVLGAQYDVLTRTPSPFRSTVGAAAVRGPMPDAFTIEFDFPRATLH